MRKKMNTFLGIAIHTSLRTLILYIMHGYVHEIKVFSVRTNIKYNTYVKYFVTETENDKIEVLFYELLRFYFSEFRLHFLDFRPWGCRHNNFT